MNESLYPTGTKRCNYRPMLLVCFNPRSKKRPRAFDELRTWCSSFLQWFVSLNTLGPRRNVVILQMIFTKALSGMKRIMLFQIQFQIQIWNNLSLPICIPLIVYLNINTFLCPMSYHKMFICWLNHFVHNSDSTTVKLLLLCINSLRSVIMSVSWVVVG